MKVYIMQYLSIDEDRGRYHVFYDLFGKEVFVSKQEAIEEAKKLFRKFKGEENRRDSLQPYPLTAPLESVVAQPVVGEDIEVVVVEENNIKNYPLCCTVGEGNGTDDVFIIEMELNTQGGENV